MFVLPGRRFALLTVAVALCLQSFSHEADAQANSVGGVRGQPRYGVLIAGLDSDPESSNRDRRTDAHTDTLVLLTSRAGSGVVDALHIPRDTRVPGPGTGFMKINGIYMSADKRALSRAVETLTGIPVNAVLMLDFSRFRRTVALVGSIPFDVDKAIWTPEGDVTLPAGWRRLNSRQALAVVRFRHEPLGDIGRVHRQERFLRSAVAVASRLPFALFAQAMRTLDAHVSGHDIAMAYAAVHPLVMYRAHSVPGNFSTGPGASYWLPDQSGLRAITGLVMGESDALPAFARWRNNGAVHDADDGRDRSL